MHCTGTSPILAINKVGHIGLVFLKGVIAKAGPILDISGPSPGLDHFPSLDHIPGLDYDPGPESDPGPEARTSYSFKRPTKARDIDINKSV